MRCDVWCEIVMRYVFRVLELRCEFCTMEAKDSTHAKLVLPALKKHRRMPAADDMNEPLQQLETHMMSQIIK